MSRQATEARAERDYRRERWLDHQRDCLQCSEAARKRTPRAMCAQGWEVNAVYAEAQAALSDEIRADKAPAPGQRALFAVGGGGGSG